MNKVKANLADERVAAQSRNITALTGVCIMNGILTLAYLVELIKGSRTLASYGIVAFFCIVPSVMSILAYRKDRCTPWARYISVVGFLILYTYIRFTTTTNLAFCYVIVIFVILSVYGDKKLSIILGAVAVLVNVLLVIYHAMTVGLSPVEITETEIIIACLVLAGVFTLMSINKIDLINQAHIEQAENEKQQSAQLLHTVLRVADSLMSKVEKATDETEKLEISVEMSKKAMENLTYGTNDAVSAISVQQQNTEEINCHIQEVGEVTASIMDSVELTEKKLTDGQNAMDNLMQQVKVSDDASRLVAKEMDELKEYADKMQGIMTLISNVADQTSLLALNASIEAARAGEAGKGFAVVASEISALAGQTSTATGDINSLIETITNSLLEVTESVGELLKSNKMQSGYVNDTATYFEQIHASTQSIFGQMNRLQNTVSAVSDANKRIIQSVENVSAVTEEVTASANETLDGSNQNLESVADIVAIMAELNKNTEELRAFNVNQ